MDTASEKTGVATELNEAVQNFNQGRFENARKICNKVLLEDPGNVTAINILAGSLARTGKTDQAIQVLEKACAQQAGNPTFHNNLSHLHGARGHVLKAVLAMARAILSDPGNTLYQAKFAQMTDHLEFRRATAETAVIKEAIRICMGNADTDLGSFSTAWHSLLLLEPVFAELALSMQSGDFKEQAEEVNIETLAGPLTDSFLLQGLQSLHATDVRLERVMTFLRHLFLSRFGDYDAASFLPFLCALAEHCNLNEHVYSRPEEDLEAVDTLEAGLDPSTGIDTGSMARIALISCYKDLMRLDCADDIAAASAGSEHGAFEVLIKNAISIPTKTREYHATIPALSPSSESAQNIVSSSVAKQYEENPYPRWRHLDIPALTEQLRTKGRDRKILIAGCGTGHESLNVAVHYPEAHVLGLDLSVPSLAYGKQKADELGIDNVEFMQADILDLENLGQQFDLISCSGVLHHMQDPVEGWGKLLGCLKPDGFMKIALYSEIARKTVVLCRNWIEEQGFASTPESIRAFRQAIMGMDAENPLKEIMSWTDFFSMSMCRDLVFHVQEHRVSLPWIKSVLDDLDLSCLSMRISNPFFRKEYLSMYPGDQRVRDLDHLHEYEEHNPATFRDMYSFWCCRKDSVTVERSPAWFFTASL